MKQIIILGLLSSSWLASGQDTLHFDQAVSEMLAYNFDIQIAKNIAEVAENNNSAGNAGMLPTLDLVGSDEIASNNTRQEFFSGDVRDATGAQSTTLQVYGELAWTIFDGFKMFATKRALDWQEQLGQIQMRLAVEEAYTMLTMSYGQLVLEQQLLDVYRQNLAVSEERLNLMSLKFKVGSANEADLLQAQVDRNSDSSQVMRQKGLIRNLSLDISALLGRTSLQFFAADAELPGYSEIQIDQLRTDVLSQNAQLLSARASAEAQWEGVTEARSSFYPQIDLYGRYTYLSSKSEVGILSSNQSQGPSAGVRLRWNLFNGMNDRRIVRNQTLFAENAEKQEKQTEVDVRSSLEKYYNDYLTATDITALEKLNLQSAKDNLAISKARYEKGAIDAITFRTVQENYIESEYRLRAAEYTELMSAIQLLRIAGKLNL